MAAVLKRNGIPLTNDDKNDFKSSLGIDIIAQNVATNTNSINQIASSVVSIGNSITNINEDITSLEDQQNTTNNNITDIQNRLGDAQKIIISDIDPDDDDGNPDGTIYIQVE